MNPSQLFALTGLVAEILVFGVLTGGVIPMLIVGLTRAQRKRRVILMTLALNWAIPVDLLLGLALLVQLGVLRFS